MKHLLFIKFLVATVLAVQGSDSYATPEIRTSDIPKDDITTVSPTIAPITSPTPTTQPDTTTPEPPVTTNTPVTTAAPEPPVPEDGSWYIANGNTTCIRANLKIRFKISLMFGQDEYITLSPNASSDRSRCDLSNTTQELVLTDANYIFRMIFREDSDRNAFVQNITLSYTLPQQSDIVYNDSKLFAVKVGNSYLCRSTEDISLTNNVTMQVFHIHIQAFGEQGNADFGSAEECEADDQVSDVIPIAVAFALCALIVVVLIAYLVARQRSRQRGYQSV
ncbi:Lysosome-associated membrane glycoprotein 1, partial [Stegodyphus mimosarum]